MQKKQDCEIANRLDYVMSIEENVFNRMQYICNINLEASETRQLHPTIYFGSHLHVSKTGKVLVCVHKEMEGEIIPQQERKT